MSRFLFVVPPLTGHVNPTVPVARALVARGHSVAWASFAEKVRPLLPEGAELFTMGEPETAPGAMEAEWVRIVEAAKGVRGLESFQFLWERVLIPLTRAMMSGVERAVSAFAPDVVVADQQAIAGALVARKNALPWVTFCTTSAGVVDALSDLPKVQQWVSAQLAEVEREAGLSHQEPPHVSKELVVVFSSLELVGAGDAFPAAYRFVGPAAIDRPDETPFPWEALEPRRRVFVSLGTVSGGEGAAFYDTCVKAFSAIDAQVILAAPPELVPNAPSSFIVRPRVPQLALLAKVDAVVCHAGHNTVCEALAHGLPLVVAPIRDDQPVVAQQVVRAGAGIRVRYGKLTSNALADAVSRVLSEESFRRAAESVRDSFTRAGGVAAAVSLLESHAEPR